MGAGTGNPRSQSPLHNFVKPFFGYVQSTIWPLDKPDDTVFTNVLVVKAGMLNVAFRIKLKPVGGGMNLIHPLENLHKYQITYTDCYIIERRVISLESQNMIFIRDIVNF